MYTCDVLRSILTFLPLVIVLAATLTAGRARARAESDDPQTIYRYVGPQGRPVYVNGRARVPEASRPQAKAVDLSQVSTNRELGSDLKVAVDAEIERLMASGYCLQLREAAKTSWLKQLWRRHGHLVLIGFVVLLLVFLSPWITQHIPAPQWGRILLLTLPVLGMLALWTTAVVKTTRATELLRSAATPCQPESYRGTEKTPQGQRKRLGMVYQLQQRIKSMQAHRTHLIDEVLRREGNPAAGVKP